MDDVTSHEAIDRIFECAVLAGCPDYPPWAAGVTLEDLDLLFDEADPPSRLDGSRDGCFPGGIRKVPSFEPHFPSTAL
jgi:hypothetical protein